MPLSRKLRRNIFSCLQTRTLLFTLNLQHLLSISYEKMSSQRALGNGDLASPPTVMGLLNSESVLRLQSVTRFGKV